MTTRPGTDARSSLDRWLAPDAPAERLAALRILIGGFATIYLAAQFGEFRRLAGRDPAEFDPTGLARLLDEPLGSAALWGAYVCLLGLGACFVAGWRYRWTAPLFGLGVLGWASYHSSWGQLLHFEHLITLHILVLAVSPASEAWSFGRRHDRSIKPASARYGWPIRLLTLATATTYVLSGIAKLRLSGSAWFEAETLANHIGYSATRMESIGGPGPPLAELVLRQRWAIVPMAIGALAVELGAPMALISHRLRNVWVVAAIGFHAATAATMLVFFGYRGLGFGLLPLFAVERAGPRVAAAMRAQPWRAMLAKRV